MYLLHFHAVQSVTNIISILNNRYKLGGQHDNLTAAPSNTIMNENSVTAQKQLKCNSFVH
jgi:hypothetical protein